MLDYLQRLHNVGILKDITVILFSTEDIAMKDIVKIRMLGIKHTLKLPLETEESLMDILEAPQPSK